MFFFLRDGDVILLFQGMTGKIVSHLKDHLNQLVYEGGLLPELQLYDVGFELPACKTLVAQKLSALTKFEESQYRSSHSRLSLEGFAFNRGIYDKAKLERTERRAPHVLIVDDDLFSRRLVTNALEPDNKVLVASNAFETLNQVMYHAPEIIFLDIDLPEADGHKILQRLKELDDEIYVVMLSGNSTRQDILKALNAGAKGFIGKPFTKEKLLHYISKATDRTRLLQPT